MKIKYTLPSIPYTLDDVHLGSFVPFIKQPNQDAFPSPPRPLRHGIDYRWRNERNISALFQQNETGMIRAHVTKLLNLGHQATSDFNVGLQSEEGRIYELLQPESFYKRMVSDLATRHWLLNAHDQGDNVHFVVGYRTYFDASRAQSNTRTTNTQGTLEIPAGQVVSAVSAAPPAVADQLDTSIEAEKTASIHDENQSELPGERIFAICFRRVRFRLFNSTGDRPEDVGKLERENCWIISSTRSGQDNFDAIEAILEDEADNEDVGLSLVCDESEVEGKP